MSLAPQAEADPQTERVQVCRAQGPLGLDEAIADPRRHSHASRWLDLPSIEAPPTHPVMVWKEISVDSREEAIFLKIRYIPWKSPASTPRE